MLNPGEAGKARRCGAEGQGSVVTWSAGLTVGLNNLTGLLQLK